MKKPSAHILFGLLIVVVQLLALAGVYDNLLADRLEYLLYDQRLIAGMPNSVDKRIAIVAIDETSLAQVGRWPWPRKSLAELVDTLFDHYRIQVLGIDAVFAEAQDNPALAVLEEMAADELADIPEFQKVLGSLRLDLQEDHYFAKSIGNYPVVLGYYFKSGATDQTIGQLPEPILLLESETEEALPVPVAAGYVSNIPILQQSAWSGGFFNIPRIDDDGIIRSVSLIERHEDFLYESFSLAVMRAVLGSPPVELVTERDTETAEYALEGLDVGGVMVPTDEGGGVLIPFRGRFGSFPYVSASAVLDRTADMALLEDRIVLLGFTATGVMDIRATPVQKAYPGVEIHANLISGMLDGRVKQKPAYALGFEFAQMLLIGLILTFLLPRLSAVTGSLLTLGVTVLVVGSNFLAWQVGLVFPLASTLILISTLFLYYMIWGFLKESRGKRWLTGLFRQYAPVELIDAMSGDDSRVHFNPKGENREMTVLFTDIRNFTHLSESLNPRQVTQLINIFLDRMTEIIYRRRGTVEKYTGDGILAFWGAPRLDHLHAQHALQSAMEMAAALPEVCQELERNDLPTINMGIGLSTGMMNVGSMGSKLRRAYMVQGDSVNLGARIEGLTKFYGSRVLVNRALKVRVPQYIYRFVDRVKVKGKDEPVDLYEPLAVKSALSDAQRRELEEYGTAIDRYQQQDWGAATSLFAVLSENAPQCRLYSIYLERSQQFLTTPPQGEFDGVFSHTSK